MTSSFMRNLPVIVLALSVAAALYMLYRNMNVLETRVDGLSRDLLMTIQNLQLVMQPQASLIPQEIPLRSAASRAAVANSSPVKVVLGEEQIFDEEAESMAPEDIEVTTSQGPTRPPQVSSPPQKQTEKPAEESQPSQVETYIGQLERYLEAEEPAMEDPNAEEDAPPVRENASEMSDSVSLSQLNSRKRVPPWPAKNHEPGHEEIYNGKVYTVIVNSKNVVRWSGAKPLTESHSATS